MRSIFGMHRKTRLPTEARRKFHIKSHFLFPTGEEVVYPGEQPRTIYAHPFSVNIFLSFLISWFNLDSPSYVPTCRKQPSSFSLSCLQIRQHTYMQKNGRKLLPFFFSFFSFLFYHNDVSFVSFIQHYFQILYPILVWNNEYTIY